MLKEHEASIVQKDKEMFHKQAQPILASSINLQQKPTNQRLDRISKGINELKDSLGFTQNEYDDKLNNKGKKLQKLEEEINIMTPELQTKKPLQAVEIDTKLVDFIPSIKI